VLEPGIDLDLDRPQGVKADDNSFIEGDPWSFDRELCIAVQGVSMARQ